MDTLHPAGFVYGGERREKRAVRGWRADARPHRDSAVCPLSREEGGGMRGECVDGALVRAPTAIPPCVTLEQGEGRGFNHERHEKHEKESKGGSKNHEWTRNI